MSRMATTRPVFMPETFTGVNRDWSDWIGQFEMAAEVNGWDDSLKLKFLSLLLSGRVRDIYCGLSTESRSSYAVLKASLGRCLEPCDSDDWNRASFLARRRLHSETAREFGNALRRLITKAYPSADNNTRDLFARDHFIEHVGSGDLRVQLRSAKPSTLEEAVNLASELELIRSLERNCSVADTKVRVVAESFTDNKQMETLLGVVEGLRQEVKTLQQTVQSLQACVERPPSGRRNVAPETWGQIGGAMDRSCRDQEACWECGCNRHLRRNCPYLQGN